jgi:hypothetical protein
MKCSPFCGCGRTRAHAIESELPGGCGAQVGAFSAASNLTGILCDSAAIAVALHRRGALACFDYGDAADARAPRGAAAAVPKAEHEPTGSGYARGAATAHAARKRARHAARNQDVRGAARRGRIRRSDASRDQGWQGLALRVRAARPDRRRARAWKQTK